MPSNILIIFWDSEYNVNGLIACKRSSETLRIEQNIAAPVIASEDFSTRLHKVYLQALNYEIEFIVIGGYLPQSMVWEVLLPPLPIHELSSALEYELPCDVPSTKGKFVKYFRLLKSRPATASGKLPIRVFIAEETSWNQLSQELIRSGIRADAFVPPLMAVDPPGQGLPIWLPDTEGDFVMTAPNKQGVREIKIADSAVPEPIITEKDIGLAPEIDFHHLPPGGILIAQYCLSPDFSRDLNMATLPLPPELKPERFRFLRRLSWGLQSLRLCYC